MLRGWCLLLLASFLFACGGGGGDGAPVNGQFLTADSRGLLASGNGGAGDPATDAPPAPGAQAAEAAGDIAREIEEADLYRVRGDTLLLLNSYRGLAIVDLATMTLRGRLSMVGIPVEMYLRGDRAFVLLQGSLGDTAVIDVSIADLDAPSARATLSMPGWFATSRIVGDILYAVTSDVVRSFRLDTPDLQQAASVAAGGAFAHATDAFLFLASFGNGELTTVQVVDISDPAGALDLRGAIDLPGYVSDPYKLHFGAGTLRVVTHDWVDRGLSRLFVVGVSDPDAPNILGSLELARGEQLFATRFTDDTAYLVTFEQVDPLWVIDLSDAAHPAVAGHLVTPGWSTHIVPDGNRLIALGIDPDQGWHPVVSLFDVSDPAHPTMLDRADFGLGWSNANGDPKGFGVFPADGLVLVPFSGETEGLAVLDLTATSLNLRGIVDARGSVQRGFPHTRGIVAITHEEVALAHRTTLAVTGRVTVAENVIDVARLPDDTIVTLLQSGNTALLRGVSLPLWAEGMHLFGSRAAVTGWDDQGRGCYVVDLGANPATVSARLDLGGGYSGGWTDPSMGGIGVGMGGNMGGGMGTGVAPRAGMAMPDMIWGGGGISGDSILTSDGKLVVRGYPGNGAGININTGTVFDGFLVVDIPTATMDDSIAVRDGVVTGFVGDGADLAFTFARHAGYDGIDRPLLRHDYVRVNLAGGTASAPKNVPGYIVAAAGTLVTTIEESWDIGWAFETAVVVSDVSGPEATTLDRLALPAGAYDLRAAGGTLWYTSGSWIMPMFASPILPGDIPSPEIGTVRLGTTLSLGPTIRGGSGFANLLLPESGSALLLRDGFIVERWDVGGATAAKLWGQEVSGYPLSARADSLHPGRYLVPLGFGGYADLP